MPREVGDTCQVWWPHQPRGRSLSALGLAGHWDLSLGLVSSREKFQLIVSADLSLNGDSTVEEISKGNVAASWSWTSMPIYGPEISLRILRAAESVGVRSIFETSVVSVRECMARVITVIQVNGRSWMILKILFCSELFTRWLTKLNPGREC